MHVLVSARDFHRAREFRVTRRFSSSLAFGIGLTLLPLELFKSRLPETPARSSFIISKGQLGKSSAAWIAMVAKLLLPQSSSPSIG